MVPIRLLLVEDEDSIAEIVVSYLKRDGIDVHRVDNGTEALERLLKESWDLALLDVMLPGLDGFEVCSRLRQQQIDIPIIFLTARAEDGDQIFGLGLGADDYILKPFSGAALVARVRAHVRRYRELKSGGSGETGQILRIGELQIDVPGCQVFRSGKPVQLTAKEFELLCFFATHRGRVFTREQLFTNIWGEEYYADDNTVTVHIRRLREKIEEEPSTPRLIQTVRGLGYRLSGDNQ